MTHYKNKIIVIGRSGILSLFVFSFLFFAIPSFKAQAANVCQSNGTGGGNFNVPATWTNCGATTPQITDSITILNGDTVTLVATTTIAGITVNNGGILNEVTFTITDSGNFTNNGALTGTTGKLTLTGSGTTIDGNGSYVPTGVVTINTGAKTITSASSLSFPSVTVTSPGIVTNNSTAGFTVSTALAGTGTFTQGSGSILNLKGTTTVTTLNASVNTNEVHYISTTGAQTIKNATYYNLFIDKSGQTATVGTPGIAVNGNLNVTAGNLSDGGFQITGNGTGTFTLPAGSTLTLGSGASATSFPTAFINGNISLNVSSTVNYNSTAAQTISSIPNYGNLTTTGATTKTADGVLTVNGNLNVTAGTFADGGFTVTVKGNSTMTGTHTGTGKILFTGGGTAHTVSGAGYNNVELNDTLGVTQSSSTTIGGTFTITGGTWTSINTLAVTGATSISGTLAITATTGTHTFGDVIVNGTWSNSINEIIGISGNLTVNAGAVFTAGTGLYTFSGVTKTIGGTIASLSIPNLTATGTIANDISTLTIPTLLTVTSPGTFTNNASKTVTATTALSGTGTFTQSSSSILNIGGTSTITVLDASALSNEVHYTSLLAQIIHAGTYHHLFLDKTAGIAGTLGGAIMVNGNLTVTAGNLVDGGFQITGNGTGTFTLPAGSMLTLGTAATATNFPISFIRGNISLNTTSIVNYNSNVTQTISSVPVYGNLTTTATGAVAKTADGAITVNGNIANGVNNTLADGGFIVTAKGNVTNNGTISGAGKLYLNGGAGSHTISGATSTFGNVELDDSNGAAWSGTGITTVSGTLTITTGALSLGAFTTSVTVNGATNIAASQILNITSTTGTHNFGDITINNGSSINFSVAENMAVNGNLTANGTGAITATTTTGVITFQKLGGGSINGSASSLSIPGAVTFATQYSLPPTFIVNTLSVSIGINETNAGTVTVNTALSGVGTFTQNINTVLNLGGTVGITTLDASVNPNDVHYTSATAGQTVKATTYYNLFLDKAGQTGTMNGTTNILGNFSSTATITDFLSSTVVITGTTDIFGVLKDQNNGGVVTFGGLLTMHSASSWLGVAGEVCDFNFLNGLRFDGTSFVPGDGFFYFLTNNQSITGSSHILIENIIVNGIQLTNNNTSSVSSGLSLSGTGEFIQGTNAVLNIGGTTSINTLTATASGNVVNYNGSVAQNVKATTYRTLDVSGNTTLDVSTGKFKNGAYIDADNSGTVTPGDIRVAIGNATFSGLGFTAGSTVALGDTDIGTIIALPTGHANLKKTGSGNVTFIYGIDGAYIDTDNTYTVTPGDIRVAIGNATFSGLGFTAGSTVALGDTDIGTIIALPTGANLSKTGSSSLYGSGGVIFIYNISDTVISDTTVSTSLIVGGAKLSTASNKIILPAGASLSRATGYVIGSLQKNVSSGSPTPIFEIGSGTDYTPVLLNFHGVTASGDVLVNTTPTDHPNIATSALFTNKTANRFWSVSNSGVSFSTYDATFNFVPTDVDVSANTANFVPALFSSGVWSYPTLGSALSTSTSATGLTSFGDFQLGEPNFPATQFSLDNPGDMFANTRLPYTVTRKNQFGDPATFGVTTAYLFSSSLSANKKFYDASSGGNIITSVDITDGNSTANFWYYDDAVGTYIITASDNAIAPDGAAGIADATDSVTVMPVATKFVILNPTDNVVGNTVTVTVQAEDAGNNVITTYNNNVTLVASGNTTGAGLVNIVNGVGTLDISDQTAETINLTLSDTQATGLDVSSSQDVIFAAGPLFQFTINNPGDTTAGTRSSYTVTRKDQFGNIITNGGSIVYLYTNSISGLGFFYDAATLGSVITSITIPDGASSANFWYGEGRVGSYSITVSDNSAAPDGSTGVEDASDSIAISSGPTSLFILNDPGDMTAGDRLAYTATREDAFNNLVTTGSDTVYLYSNGSSPTKEFYNAGIAGNVITSINILNGVSSANFWYFDDTTGTWIITASDNAVAPDGVTGITDGTDNVTVNAIPVIPTKIIILNPTDSIAGSPTAVTVKAVDDTGALDTSFDNTVTLNTSGSTLGGGIITILGGIGTVNINDNSAETVNLSLSDTGGTALDVSSTQDVIFSPGPVTQYTINDPGNNTAGFRSSYMVTRKDQFGNLVTSGINTVYLYTNSLGILGKFYDAGSGGNIIVSTNIVDGQSSSSFWYEEGTAGSWTVTVSDNNTAPDGNTGIADVNDPILISPAVTHDFTLNDPGNMTAGTRLNYTVTREDLFGNLVTNGPENVYLYSSSTSVNKAFFGAVTGGSAINFVTIPDGASSINFWYFDDTAGTFIITASDNSSSPDGAAGIADAADSVIVNNAPIVATKFVINAAPDVLIGATATVTINAEDNNGNTDTTFTGNVTLAATGSVTGEGVVHLVHGIGTIDISDNVAETSTFSILDTSSTGLDVSSTQTINFNSVLVLGGSGGEIAIPPNFAIKFSGKASLGSLINVLGIPSGGSLAGAVSLGQDVVSKLDGSFTLGLNNPDTKSSSYAVTLTDENHVSGQVKFFPNIPDVATLNNIVFAPTINLLRSAIRKTDFLNVYGYANPGSVVQAQFDGTTSAKETVATASDGTYKLLISTANLALGKHTVRVKSVTNGKSTDFSLTRSFTLSNIFRPIVDLNDDGIVDVRDINIFNTDWASTDPAVRIKLDFNGDGKVDLQDVSIFTQALKH